MEVHGRRLTRAVVLPLYHVLALRSEAVIVTSRKNADISRDLPRGARTTTIPMGISPEEFRINEVERNRALDWRRSLVGDAPTIGFVGRHVRYKGLDTLMEALAYLPCAHALIGGNGPLHEQTKQLASNLGVRDRAHFLGYLSHGEKKRLLAASDVFAFPSTEVTEAFGFSQLEAMAAGVPVVASDLPTGVTDVAIDRETALLAKPGDALDLASCFSEILRDRALGSRLATAAREHVATHFAKKAVIRETCEVIERALGCARSRTSDLTVPEAVVASSAT
jgi:rhamnosyl/mannosyltransferase